MINNEKYKLVYSDTGEKVPVDIFVDNVPIANWENYYAEVLAKYLGVSGKSTISVLIWLIKNKDSDNRVIATFSDIAKNCNTTIPTVSVLFQKMYKKEVITKIQNGIYKLSLKLLNVDNNVKGAVLFYMYGI